LFNERHKDIFSKTKSREIVPSISCYSFVVVWGLDFFVSQANRSRQVEGKYYDTVVVWGEKNPTLMIVLLLTKMEIQRIIYKSTVTILVHLVHNNAMLYFHLQRSFHTYTRDKINWKKLAYIQPKQCISI